MFIEHINKDITFYDGENVYKYDDLIRYVKCAQHRISKILDKPSVIGFCSESSFFELTSILAFLELGHKILFVPRKHIFYYNIHDNFFDQIDIIVNLIGDDINGRGKLVIKKDFLYSSDECGELIIETDNQKTGFVFLSSGTTGKPKVIEQTHARLIYAAHQTMNRIWCDNKNFLLHRGNTINHLGIFTTTYLPSLFIGENVSWYSHNITNGKISILHSDTKEIYNATLIFPYQPKDLIHYLPFSNETKIITGGSTISDEFIEQLFENQKITLVYNVYGATEIITPIMWNKIDRETKNKNFIEVSDGLIINLDKNNQILSIGGFIDTNKDINIPDTLKEVEGEYVFVGRKQNLICRPIKKTKNDSVKNKVHNITLTEDELLKILSSELGEFRSPTPIIVKNDLNLGENVEYYLIFDPELHVKINELSVEKLNEIVYIYHGITSNNLDIPLITDKILINNLSDFNNGLKLDRGLIKKIVINKINKTNKNLI